MSDAKTTTCGLCQAAFPYEPQLLPPNSFMVEIPAPHLCPDCTAAETQRREAEIEQERREEERRDDARRNLPCRYRDASFASFTAHSESQARALAAVRDHAMEGVYLQGRAGCGKTHLAAAAISVAPSGSLFVASTELLDDIRVGYEGAGRGLYERAKQAPLLALDDLGAEAVTDWVRDRLYTLLNRRWNECRPLIVTTNCAAALLAQRTGEGATSRLAGICARRIEVTGPDLRRRKGGLGAALRESPR